MSENAGMIKYTIEADTSDLLRATTAVNKSTDAMSASLGGVDAKSRQLNTSLKTTGQQTGKFNHHIQNASYQLSDMAVQIQGNINPMVVMSQQIPQLIGGMGLWGAAIGASVAVLGLLMTSLNGTETNLQKMQKSIEHVKAIMTIGADGVANYTDEMERLRRVSESLAAAKVTAAIEAQKDAIRRNYIEIQETIKSFGKFYDERAEAIAEKTKLPVDAINELQRAAAIKGAEGVKAIESAIEKLRVALPDANNKGKELFNALVNLSAQLVEGDENLKRFNGSTESLSSKTTTASSTAAEMTLTLIAQRIALEEGERAAFAFSLQKDGLSEIEKKAALTLYDYNKELERSNDLKKAASAELESEIDGYIRLADATVKAEEAKANQNKLRVASQVSNVGLTPLDEIQKRYEDERSLLIEAKELEIITKAEYAEREKQIEKEKIEAIAAYNKQQIQNQQLLTTNQTQALGALSSLFSTFASATDTQNKKSFERAKKFSIAQALVNTLLSVSQAMASAPPPLNFVLASAAALAGAATVGQIRSQQFGGGREFGGPVTAGNMYRVGEKGPEIFSSGGKNYMIPDQNGGVTSNKDAFGGGGNTANVNMTLNLAAETPADFADKLQRNSVLIESIVQSALNDRGERL